MPKLMTVGIVLGTAVVLCGFTTFEVKSRLDAYRGEPVQAAVARLGPPLKVAYAGGQQIYYWRAAELGHVCKIWGAAQHNVIVRWGYQSCAF